MCLAVSACWLTQKECHSRESQNFPKTSSGFLVNRTFVLEGLYCQESDKSLGDINTMDWKQRSLLDHVYVLHVCACMYKYTYIACISIYMYACVYKCIYTCIYGIDIHMHQDTWSIWMVFLQIKYTVLLMGSEIEFSL